MDDIKREEFLTEEAANRFSEVLRGSIENYTENLDIKPVNEWLNGYLTAQMPDKSAEEISNVCNCIMDTIEASTEKIAALNKAAEKGQSAESWFAEDVAKSRESLGSLAKDVTESYSELTKISNSYEPEEEHEEVIDVEVISPEAWEEDNWNKYKIKDALLDTARQAGNVAIMNTANDLYQKVTELGFKAVLTDKELIKESILYGKDTGLKAATAGALEIAKDRNILPIIPEQATPIDFANMAVEAIETLKVLGRAAKGEITISQAITEIKNHNLAIISGLFSEKVSKRLIAMGGKIGERVVMVFGPAGAVVCGLIGGIVGKLAGTKIGQKAIEVGKKVCSTAKSVASKVWSGVKSTASKVWNGLKSFFR